MILDLITYFAKFPAREAVTKHFNRDTEKYTGYDSLKSTLQEQDGELLPQITGFFAGMNDEWLIENIRNSDGYWMMVEYGNMPVRKNKNYVIEGELSVQLTIGYHTASSNIDMFEELIIANEALDMINSVIETMRNDDAEGCLFGRVLEKEYTLTPLEPNVMDGSMGWFATFKQIIDAR